MTVDADTRLADDAVLAMRSAFALQSNLVAAAGILVPVCSKTMSGRFFQWFQTYEYIRNFIARFAWMRADSLLLISGAFASFRRDALLTLYVLAPLPLLAVTIYYVNSIIHKKSERIQALLSDLTTNAQESFSGIRVIKSFVQETNMRRFFNATSEEYRKSSVNLSLTEAIYFPAMNFFIGLSMLSTVLIGGYPLRRFRSLGAFTPNNPSAR